MKRLFQLGLALAAFFLGIANGQAELKCFYGNLHAHTSYSDGKSTPDSAFAYARDMAQLQVEALTEHNNYTDKSITPAQYQNLRLVADTFTIDGQYVALAGQEIGIWSSNGFGHINIFEAPELLAYIPGNLLGTYQAIIDMGYPAMFNHPTPGPYNCPNFANLHYYPDYSQAMYLLEVMNSDYNYENAYLLALNNGWQVGASANQDNHDHNWGNAANSSGRILLTGIWADTLTKASVLEALQARRTFATMVYPATDRMEVSLKSEEHWQGEHFITSNSSISFQIKASAIAVNFKKIYLYTDGVATDSLSLNNRDTLWNLDKEVKWGKHYFFVKAVQADNDLAWTSPLFIDVMQEVAKSKVVTWPTPVVESCQIVYQPLNGVTNINTSIYDVAGNKIWEYDNSDPSAILNWNSKDLKGNLVPNGLYIIKIEQRNPVQTSNSIGKTVVSR
jgi:predicted metal-dependent phosphoesterase TrpH